MLHSFILPTLLALAPFLAWRWLTAAVAPWRWRRGRWIDPTIMAGAMLGLGLLTHVLPEGALGFYPIFGVGGFWDITFTQLIALAERSAASVSLRLVRETPSEWLVWYSLAAGLWLSRLAVALPRSPRRTVPMLLAADAGVCAASAVGAGWTGLLLVWVAGQLNIWLLLLAILLIQDARYAHPPRRQIVIAWLWDMSGRCVPDVGWLNPIRARWKRLAQHRLAARNPRIRPSARLPGTFRRTWIVRSILARGKAFSAALAGSFGLKTGL